MNCIPLKAKLKPYGTQETMANANIHWYFPWKFTLIESEENGNFLKSCSKLLVPYIWTVGKSTQGIVIEKKRKRKKNIWATRVFFFFISNFLVNVFSLAKVLLLPAFCVLTSRYWRGNVRGNMDRTFNSTNVRDCGPVTKLVINAFCLPVVLGWSCSRVVVL